MLTSVDELFWEWTRRGNAISECFECQCKRVSMEHLQGGEGRNVVCNVLGQNNSRGLAWETNCERSEKETTPTI